MTLGWIWWHAWGPLVARGAAALCVAGVALARSCVLRGRRGTYGTGRGLVGHLVAVAAFCVAGVALGDIHWRLTWQAWHLLRSIFVLRGRRGTYALCQKDRCIFVPYDVSANAVFSIFLQLSSNFGINYVAPILHRFLSLFCLCPHLLCGQVPYITSV